jgi:uncharacterized integral membrane protein (TIGR00698 family)
MKNISPIFIGLIFGLILGNVFQIPEKFKKPISTVSKRSMRLGIVLMGFQLSVGTLKTLGIKSFIAIFIIFIITFTTVFLIYRKAGSNNSLALLIASGFSICGVSAISAVSAVKKSAKDETAYAIALVTLLGTLSIFVIPPVAHLLKLSNSLTGSWIGAAVHDVGQVVATASAAGSGTLQFAIVTKLARVLLIVPMLLILSRGGAEKGLRRFLPLFILGFLISATARNFFTIDPRLLGDLSNLSKYLLAIGVFTMALDVRLSKFKNIGLKPLLLGIGLWIGLGATALGVLKIAN